MSADYAPYIRILGRGPNKSRHLTQEEARRAFTGVLNGHMSDHQVGALLLLWRYRGESPSELAGIVEAVRDHLDLPVSTGQRDVQNSFGADLIDWPSYSSGKSRRLPWFLLSAKLLAEQGFKIFMHGYNSHLENGLTTEECLSAIGVTPATSLNDANDRIARTGFAFLPLRQFCPQMLALLEIRKELGVRSIINTAVKLINPLNAATLTLGIFHPAYIALNIEAAKLLSIPCLGVIKGGGGEAERNILKKIKQFHVREGEENMTLLPAYVVEKTTYPVSLDYLRDIWQGTVHNEYASAMITGSAAQMLYLTGRVETIEQADKMAQDFWLNRKG